MLAGATIFERALRLGRNMILARILAPDQFGLMAIVMLVNSLFEAITEVGVRQSVIQNKHGASDAFLNIAWWFNATRGIVIFGLGYMAAPWVCDFYEDPSLLPVLRFGLLAFPLASFVSTRMFVLQRELRIGPYAIIMQGSGLFSTLVTLVAVLYIPNVWALVIGFVVEPAFRVVASFVACPIKPSLRFDRELAGEFFTFARRMALLGLMSFLVGRMDVFFLAKLISKEELGMYSLALSLADIPRFGVSRVIGPLLLPMLATVQDDLPALKRELLAVTRAMLALLTPLAAGLIVLAAPLLRLVYGEPYGVMAMTFRFLCVYLLVAILGRTIMSVYMAIGRPDYQRGFSLLRLVLLASAMYPAIVTWGTEGAAVACLCSLVVTFGLQLLHLRSILGLGILRYLAAAGSGLALAVVVGLPGIALVRFSGGSDLTLLAGVGALVALALGTGGWRILNKTRVRAAAATSTT